MTKRNFITYAGVWRWPLAGRHFAPAGTLVQGAAGQGDDFGIAGFFCRDIPGAAVNSRGDIHDHKTGCGQACKKIFCRKAD